MHLHMYGGFVFGRKFHPAETGVHAISSAMPYLAPPIRLPQGPFGGRGSETRFGVLWASIWIHFFSVFHTEK